MEENLKGQFKVEVSLLYREAYFAKMQYILLYKLYNEILKNNENFKYVYGSIFDALEFSVLSKLTKIYDTDTDKQSITLLHVFNKLQSCKELNNNDPKIKKFTLEILKELKSKDKEIEKIKVCRDKIVAHLDKKYPRGLLSLSADEQLNFEILKESSYYAYEKLKKLYELAFNEELLDTKQFEFLELELNDIYDKLK